MTGRYTARTFRKVSCHMDPAEVTVAETLRAGRLHDRHLWQMASGRRAARSPDAQGFDEVVTLGPSSIGAAAHVGRELLQPRVAPQRPAARYRGYCMDVFTDAAIDFIKQNRDRPFFVYLPANLIHTPLVAARTGRQVRSDGTDKDLAIVYGMMRAWTTTSAGCAPPSRNLASRTTRS